MKQDHPWQVSPAELISYALKHLDSDSEFDRRIAFLLIDVGIETTLKIYLQLPESIVGTKVSFGRRKAAAEGTFHDLINMISKISPKKLEGINLDHIEFYHGRRNLLYHQGFGISINADYVLNYAKLSTLLLKNLLSVDLTNKVITKIPDETKKEQEQLINSINEIKLNLRRELQGFSKNTSKFLKKIKPEFTTFNFEQNFPITLSAPLSAENIFPIRIPVENEEQGNFLFNQLPIELKEYISVNPKHKDYILEIAFGSYNYFVADFLFLFFDYMSFNKEEKINPSAIVSSSEEFIKNHHPWRVFDYKKLTMNELESISKEGKELVDTLRKINGNLQKKWGEGIQ